MAQANFQKRSFDITSDYASDHYKIQPRSGNQVQYHNGYTMVLKLVPRYTDNTTKQRISRTKPIIENIHRGFFIFLFFLHKQIQVKEVNFSLPNFIPHFNLSKRNNTTKN